uniref:non-specific serine/threonine protein kinase n=1 Tax=Henneguya salminicola TaxID=69463 RepID=A0A6G3MF69_HENSL
MKNRKAEKLRNEFDKGFHEGFTLTDILKRQWRLGNLIGRGGFGNVYTVFPCDSSQVSEYKISDFSAKIEPHSNGPLFTEVAFYQRVATQEKISNWCSKKGLKFLGIPPYLSTGCDKTNKPHRFIILARLGLNVENIWQEMNKNFSTSTIYQIGYRLLECLEYIHQFGYSHGDIKTSNLMTGYNDDLTNCRIYLMDFGLACSFMNKSIHKQYKEDPKRRHDGTIEYTSLDAHNGVAVSRRGDLVNLGFVILHLLQGDLPWISLISDKEKVLFEKSM